jgi:phosphoenolpyruvate-protein kinase (PTS system EI component)
MISGPNDIARAKLVIEDERNKLAAAGTNFASPKIGVMVEVPSAVVLIDQIFEMVDFVCIGTNDLVQYLLAVDRDNESVADWYQTLHPAVIRSIQAVLRSAESANKPAVLCGEMAGSAFYTPLLVGLGAKEFSMNVNAIAAVRNVIAGISFEESVELARLVESSIDSKASETIIKQFHAEKWPHLFPSPEFSSDDGDSSVSVAEK